MATMKHGTESRVSPYRPSRRAAATITWEFVLELPAILLGQGSRRRTGRQHRLKATAGTALLTLKHPALRRTEARIRGLRQRDAPSQEALADPAGIGRSWIGVIENSVRNRSTVHLVRFVKALRARVDDLVPYQTASRRTT
jgi:DNA-binding XRE family transcriptional regulator